MPRIRVTVCQKYMLFWRKLSHL